MLRFFLLLTGFVAAAQKHEGDSRLADMATMADVNAYLEDYFYREDTLTEERWRLMLPTDGEVLEMRAFIALLYKHENISNAILSEFSRISDFLDLTVFKETYYILHEKIPPNRDELFRRGWGYIAITIKGKSLRNLHHSAAHFESDGPVCKQAATLFEASGGRSLVIAGASRYAVKGNSSTPCQPSFTSCDAAHAKETMFNQMNVAIRDLSEREALEENRIPDDVFIQWHGMAETSCKMSDVFVSTGLPNNTIYDTVIPATTIVAEFNSMASGMTASTPRQDVDCKLTAGSNVFGRYINGVRYGCTCHENAKPENVFGAFVHIEQKQAGREALDLWSTVLQNSFPIESS